MRKQLLGAIGALGICASAHAGFINGGFEAGNFSGWLVESGSNFGGAITYAPSTAHAYIISTGGPADPYSPYDVPFNGNFMARLNEVLVASNTATRISQTATMLAGETAVFVNWGAVMEDPLNPPHTVAEEPFFRINVYKNNVLIASENHVSSQGVAGGWQTSGQNPTGSAQIYYDDGTFTVGGLVAGDVVRVELEVADCALGGHSGWAYLDGIGTVAQPPTVGVPDGGATAMMLLPVLSGLVALRRKS